MLWECLLPLQFLSFSSQTETDFQELRVFFRMQLFLLLLFLLSHVAMVMAVDGCHSDRDKDHRPRENCTAAGFSDVPAGFEPTTKVLLFPSNLFSSLSWSSFQIFTEIYEIDLAGNKVPEVTSSVSPILPSLSVLRLGSNRLTSLSDGSFSACPALTELYLDNNAMDSLSDHTFSGLSKLEILDLTSNHIKVLPGLMLHPLPAIETLYLENNKIKVMPDDWFSQKEEVPYLYLSANPWACSCSLGYLRRYLDDYELNVYIRDGPLIKSDADSVVCDSPQWHKGKPVMSLEETDLCSPATESGPTGDFYQPIITISPYVTTTAPTTTIPATITVSSPPPPAATTPPTAAAAPTTTIPATITVSSPPPPAATTPPTTTIPATITVSSPPPPATPPTAAAAPTTTIPATITVSSPPPPAATTPPTTTIPATITVSSPPPPATPPTAAAAPTTPVPATTSTATPAFVELHTEYHRVVTWSWYHSFTRLTEWSDFSGSKVTGEVPLVGSHTLATHSSLPTVRPSTESPADMMTTMPTKPEATKSVPLTVTSTTPRLQVVTTATATEATTTLTPSRGKISAVRGAGVFCCWLFAGCLLLCVASAACVLATLATLVIWYRRAYKPLRVMLARRGGCSEGVRLLTYSRRKEKEVAGGGGVMELYRSVMFIHREGGEAMEMEDGGKEGEGGGGKERLLVTLEPTGGGGARREEEGERGGREERGVYRKTLYRLLSKEEEIEGWRDVMEECRVSAEDGGRRGGGKDEGMDRERSGGGVSRKCYSVILREKREEAGGGREELDWVVGGWEVKRGGGGGEEPRSSWGEWLAHYLPSMPWGVTTPPEGEAAQ